MNAANVISTPLRYLDKALNGLRDLGLMPEKPDEMPVVALINQISDLDEEKTIAIARTLSNTTVFNEVVREQITAMNVGERYETITNAFNSIRDDAKSMVEQLDDGKIDTLERLSNFWMKVTRGDIPSRFRKIKKTYLEVSADTKDQMEREGQILESYRDFRGALKESQVMAFQVLKKAETAVEVAKARLEEAAKALEAYTGQDREQIARLELTRDERLRDLQEEDKRYQIAKDLAENLSVSYNTTEVVMARLAQTSDVKERVYSQAVSFFGTNETVFTALNASFTSLQGLHEGTETLNAMKDGYQPEPGDPGRCGRPGAGEGLAGRLWTHHQGRKRQKTARLGDQFPGKVALADCRNARIEYPQRAGDPPGGGGRQAAHGAVDHRWKAAEP